MTAGGSGPVGYGADDGERLWIVQLRIRSAARLRGDGVVKIVASPTSELPIAGVKLRNLKYTGEEGKSWIGGLVLEAAGKATGSAHAVTWLGSLALSYSQVIAVAANAAVSQEVEVLAYTPPTDKLPGRFHAQRPAVPDQPAARVRAVDPVDLLDVLTGLTAHQGEERMHRAIAQYMIALEYIAPLNWMLASEHLFVAVENLAHLILLRLYEEAGATPSGKAKHDLAVAAGFPPKGTGNQHLSDFDSFVRLHHVFGDDEACYRNLKHASDHFEHGSRGFVEVRDAAEAAGTAAFTYVRRALLREVGVPATSGLLAEGFDYPLGGWHPGFEVFGDYHDPACEEGRGFDESGLGDDWPSFGGVNLQGRIGSIHDDDEASVRHISFQVDGNGASLTNEQSIASIGTVWSMPGLGPDEAKPTETGLEARVRRAPGEAWQDMTVNGDYARETRSMGPMGPDS